MNKCVEKIRSNTYFELFFKIKKKADVMVVYY